MHFYDDIDTWELYDLEKDPQELQNLYGQSGYTKVQERMHKTLDSLQREYKVTDAEFTKASKASIEQAYRNFARLAGEQ